MIQSRLYKLLFLAIFGTGWYSSHLMAQGDLDGFFILTHQDHRRLSPLCLRGARTALPMHQPASYGVPANVPCELRAFYWTPEGSLRAVRRLADQNYRLICLDGTDVFDLGEEADDTLFRRAAETADSARGPSGAGPATAMDDFFSLAMSDDLDAPTGRTAADAFDWRGAIDSPFQERHLLTFDVKARDAMYPFSVIDALDEGYRPVVDHGIEGLGPRAVVLARRPDVLTFNQRRAAARSTWMDLGIRERLRQSTPEVRTRYERYRSTALRERRSAAWRQRRSSLRRCGRGVVVGLGVQVGGSELLKATTDLDDDTANMVMMPAAEAAGMIAFDGIVLRGAGTGAGSTALAGVAGSVVMVLEATRRSAFNFEEKVTIDGDTIGMGGSLTARLMTRNLRLHENGEITRAEMIRRNDALAAAARREGAAMVVDSQFIGDRFTNLLTGSWGTVCDGFAYRFGYDDALTRNRERLRTEARRAKANRPLATVPNNSPPEGLAPVDSPPVTSAPTKAASVDDPAALALEADDSSFEVPTPAPSAPVPRLEAGDDEDTAPKPAAEEPQPEEQPTEEEPTKGEEVEPEYDGTRYDGPRLPALPAPF